MATHNLDLSNLLPKQYRNRTLTTLIRSLFNNHLSRDESVILHGYVGSEAGASAGEIYIRETDLERQVNQLTPVLYSKHGAVERALTWSEIVQRLVTLGVPYSSFADWLKVEALNFVPFIDLDKFSNYTEYVWVGKWLVNSPALPWESLGIPSAEVLSTVATFNPSFVPDYYVIKRGEFAGAASVPPYAPLTSWSDWGLSNLWVHREDALAFQRSHSSLSLGDLTQALRPIMEYDDGLKLNLYSTDGAPSNTGTVTPQQKLAPNQPPLFDLYYSNGVHTNLISAGFFYQEASSQPVDSALGRRIIRDDAADPVFGHSFTHPTSNVPLFLKRKSMGGFVLTSPWTGAADLELKHVKYESSGTLVNEDKLLNYKNYRWLGSSAGPFSGYNPNAVPEYVVIERGGTSGWSADNRWVHERELTSADQLKFAKAAKPIIEFNKGLEAELVGAKTAFGQHPKFKLYSYEADAYVPLSSSTNARLTDAYTQGRLFVNVNDLPARDAVLASSEQRALLVSIGDELYAQSLLNGFYKQDIAFPAVGSVYKQENLNGGQLIIESIEPDALPHVVTLAGQADGTFKVTSTLTSAVLPALTVNTSYTLNGVTIKVTPGATAFGSSSRIEYEVKTSLFQPQTLYVKVDDSYRTVEQLTGYLETASLENRLIETTIGQGTWQYPTAMLGNLNSELSSSIRLGDLYSHFISIIEGQPGLVGSAAGSNNWRALPSKDFSKGGLLKIFNDRLPLLLGLASQDFADPITLLEFGQESYTQALNRIREFVEQELVNTGGFLSAPGVIDDSTYGKLRAYLERESAVTASSSSVIDDTVNKPYASSSMPIKALTLTAPYLGLAPVVQPQVVFDGDQNMTVLLHHDGHRSSLPTVDFSILKRLVSKRFVRSNGQETSGFVGGPVPPSAPFKQHFWLDLSSEQLFTYDVVSDTGELPENPKYGSFSSNRQTGEVWQFNGAWTSLGTAQHAQEAPWKKVDLASTLTALLLKFETELYLACPPQAPAIDVAALRAHPSWMSMLQQEFESFAARFGIIDPYESAYDPTNAFTWSYYGAGFGTSLTWQDVYLTVYGTSRPDLYPYISCGYASESAFLIDMIGSGALPVGTAAWVPSMWTIPLVQGTIKSFLSLQGRPLQTSVNFSNGSLLPPFAFGNAEQLLSSPPPDPTRRFQFGELGPVERAWVKSLDFVTATLKTYFRLDPMTFTHRCWGDEPISIDGYELIKQLGKKAQLKDVLLHGEPFASTMTSSSCAVTVSSAPITPVSYTITVTSSKNNIVYVREEGSFFGISYQASAVQLGSIATAVITPGSTGLNIGDVFHLSIDDLGLATVTYSATTLGLEGLSQLYAHYHKANGHELSYSADRTSLLGWEPKLAYRFNTLVDTDALTVKYNDEVLASSGYSVMLKETELQSASWLTGFRVTLIRKGSVQVVNGKPVPAKIDGGQRGDDWLYRVDLTNPKHPELEWYEFESSSYETFYALEGKSTLEEWRRPTVKTVLRRLNGPFIVKGIQALASFIFGYEDRAAELGYVFNDPQDPVTDPLTGRLLGWQVQVEQLIDSQFNEPDELSQYQLTPFKNRIWFKTTYGFLSDMSKAGSSKYLPMLLTTSGVKAPVGSYRVFRDGGDASIISDVELAGALLTTSTFEHLLILDSTIGDVTLFNPTLGQRADRLFFTGFKQAVPTGRPIYGGKYLLGGQMKTNIEGSIGALNSLYDVTALKSESMFDQASSLIGFERKSYHADLNTTLPTQLEFWKGMLKSKGTNRSIDSFTNSTAYRSALIDEVWAYKVADYGDLRKTVKVELNVNSSDNVGERTNFLLLESDEATRADEYDELGGYDMEPYEVSPYDMYTLYTSSQVDNMDFIDPRGCIIVKSDDEARWNSFNDLGSISYMKAVVLGSTVITPTSLEAIYTVRDENGKELLADCFELVELDALTANVYDAPVQDITSFMKLGSKVYRETGDYISGTDPAEYSAPKFKRINASQLVILDPTLLTKRLKVLAYGPPGSRFSPSSLYRDEGGRDTPINRSIIWWDPARGVHTPEAYAAVDYETKKDPAKYTDIKLKAKSKQADGSRVWGAEQVGKVWWNTEKLAWSRYYDTAQYSDPTERLQRWGAAADWAEVELCEWVESTSTPEAYVGSGEPAVKTYLTRQRSWYQRPVAWLFSANPQASVKQPLKKNLVELSYTGDSIISANGQLPAFTLGEKVARVQYTDVSRTQIVKPIGELEVTSAPFLVLGSTADVNAPAYQALASFTDLQVSLIGGLGSELAYGQVKLDYEREGVLTYLRATFIETGKTQRALIEDTPIKADTRFEVVFYELGLKITAVTTYGHVQAWGGLGVLDQEHRAERAGIELGNTLHDVIIRQAVSVKTIAAPSATIFEGPASATLFGWISWADPAAQLSADDLDLRFGSWEPIVGDWTLVTSTLVELKPELQRELQTPQPVRRFEERWGAWSALAPEVHEATYCLTSGKTHLQVLQELSFPSASLDDMARAALYVNGYKATATIKAGPAGYYLHVDEAAVKLGSIIRAELPFKYPTSAELKLKLEGQAFADPTKLVEYTLDYPYVKHEERNEFGRITKTRYYFWVKNKETPAAGKKLSVKLASAQLKNGPDVWIAPQVLKRFNQLDGRPNRYALLSVNGISKYVRNNNLYKLRLAENGTMRDTDADITLRPAHVEWKLIRKNQPTRIPKELWDKLVDTVCGVSGSGEALPYSSYADYDLRNNSTSRIGLKQGQVLTDNSIAKSTIKGVLLNTSVVVFNEALDMYVPAPLSFAGYDPEMIDTYLATATSAREFMANVWSFGNARNINELFFAVLEDALASSYELADIMKTSYVTLDDVRTVVVE